MKEVNLPFDCWRWWNLINCEGFLCLTFSWIHWCGGMITCFRNASEPEHLPKLLHSMSKFDSILCDSAAQLSPFHEHISSSEHLPGAAAGLHADPSHASGAICRPLINQQKTTSHYLLIMVPSIQLRFQLTAPGWELGLCLKQSWRDSPFLHRLTKEHQREVRKTICFQAARANQTVSAPLRANSLSFYILHHRRDAH